MNSYEMIIAVVFVVVTAGLIRHYMSLQHKRGGMGQDEQRKVTDLEERVRNLEKIVTDQGYEVRKAFDDLEREGDQR